MKAATLLLLSALLTINYTFGLLNLLSGEKDHSSLSYEQKYTDIFEQETSHVTFNDLEYTRLPRFNQEDFETVKLERSYILLKHVVTYRRLMMTDYRHGGQSYQELPPRTKYQLTGLGRFFLSGIIVALASSGLWWVNS